MLCAQQNCFSYFGKNITCLHAGLLRIGQVFSVSWKTVYRRVMTIAISCAKCLLLVDLHYVCILQGLQRSWLICRAYYCIQPRRMCRRTAQNLLVQLSRQSDWLRSRMPTLDSRYGHNFFLRQHLSPTPGLDISLSRHEMKECVRNYAVAKKKKNTPTKRARSVRPNAVFL